MDSGPSVDIFAIARSLYDESASLMKRSARLSRYLTLPRASFVGKRCRGVHSPPERSRQGAIALRQLFRNVVRVSGQHLVPAIAGQHHRHMLPRNS